MVLEPLYQCYLPVHLKAPQNFHVFRPRLSKTLNPKNLPDQHITALLQIPHSQTALNQVTRQQALLFRVLIICIV